MKISTYNLKKSNDYTANIFRKYETIFHNERLNHSLVKKIDKGHSSKIEPASLISILNLDMAGSILVNNKSFIGP